jgi:hypothetical protein
MPFLRPRLFWPLLAILLVLVAPGCTKKTPTPTAPTAPTIALTVGLNPTVLVGGSTVQGTVTLSSAATDPLTVTLTSSNTAAATVPTTVVVPAGNMTATFTVTTLQVQLPATVNIAASHSVGSGSAATVPLQVQQIPVCGPFLTTPVTMPLVIFADDGDPRTHFNPSGWFGDTGDITLTTASPISQAGTTSTRIDYKPTGPQKFAGVFWQCGDFANTQNTGFNLSQAKQVQFWARAATNGVKSEFKAGGITGTFSETLASTPTNPVVVDLGTDWRQFSIDVNGKSTSRVLGGLVWVTNTTQNPGGATIFVDEIVWR